MGVDVVVQVVIVGFVAAEEDVHDGTGIVDGRLVGVAEVVVAGVVVREVKWIEQLILNYVDMLRWSHLYHLYFYFLSSLCQGHDDDELPPLIVGYGCK